MKRPVRIPVKFEQYLINSIGVCWQHINNKDLRFQMNMLAEMLHEELNKKNGRRAKKIEKEISAPKTEQDDLRKFIALFRDRYAHETDMEYKSKLNPDEIGMIRGMVKKLRDKEVDIDEYLNWIFDDFYNDDYNRRKFSPTIKLICGTFLAAKFFMNNRDRFRKRRIATEEKSIRETIRQHGKILFRKTNDPEIQKMLRWEDSDTIGTQELERYLKDYEEKTSGADNVE